MQSQPLFLFALSSALFTCAGAALAAENPGRSTQAVAPLTAKLKFDQDMQDARALIKNERAADAYALLQPYEFEHSGEEPYDYLLGIAALDSGKPDKATFALERVLAINPGSAAARMEMARAYYQLGDLPRAKTEFLAVLKQNPSATARANIEHYLDEIAARDGSRPARFSAYIEATVGRDSNVNNSTSQSQIYVDAISSSATLDPSNIQNADNYHALAAGGEVLYRGNSNWGLYAGADVRQRSYISQKDFNAVNIDARLGIILSGADSRLRLGINDGQLALNNTPNRQARGIHAEWSQTLSQTDTLKLGGQYLQYRFSSASMQQNDYDLQALSLGWQHLLNEGKASTLLSLYQGQEKDVSTLLNPPASPDGGRTDGAKNFSGLRMGAQAQVSNATTVYAQAGMQQGTYSKTNYWFQRQRLDRFYDLTVGAQWNWRKFWSMRTQLNYALNESNIEIYGFNRTDVSLSVRRDFR
jgi:outer membrane protein